MHIIFEKISKIELHSSKTLFWWLSSNFAIFSCKMSVTFESSQDILCSKTEEEDIKKLIGKESQK